MSYTRFEDIPVWRMAVELAVRTCVLTEQWGGEKLVPLRERLEAAAASVSSKVAEGFDRGSKAEMLSCLSAARGHVAEVRSLLCIVERLPAFAALHNEMANLKSVAENVSRRLKEAAEAVAADQAGPARPYGAAQARPQTRAQAEVQSGSTDFLHQLKQIQGFSVDRPQDEP